MRGVTTGDQVTVLAVGQGLKLADHPEIVVKNCSPALLSAMAGGTNAAGQLEVHVSVVIPPEAVGAGAGMASEYANTDLMGAYAGLDDDLSLGLESLRSATSSRCPIRITALVVGTAKDGLRSGSFRRGVVFSSDTDLVRPRS